MLEKCVLQRITESMNHNFIKIIILKEMKFAITVLPSGKALGHNGDYAKIGNWIILLSSIYKMFPKLLVKRIHIHLLDIIYPNQTWFVGSRNILNKSFLAQAAMEWAMENDWDLMFLFLDFEKAFDLIEWSF